MIRCTRRSGVRAALAGSAAGLLALAGVLASSGVASDLTLPGSGNTITLTLGKGRTVL